MMGSHLVSGLVLGVVEGAVLYVIDCRVGVRAYRWWYGLTHREPMAEGIERGFILNQRANARFTIATLVALAQNGLALMLHMVDPFTAMLTIAVEVPVLMGGFYLGPFVRRLWHRKDPLLDMVDQLENGQTTIGAQVKRATERVAEALRHDDAPPNDAAAIPAVPPPVAHEAEHAAPPEPDPVEAMRRFTKRQQ
jgi:hypothetical protein